MKKIQPQTLSNVLATFQRKRLFLAIAAQCMFAAPAFAGPEGGKVVGGSGSIDQSGNLTTVVQDTQSLALDWDSFNVNADETVRFIQPGEDSVALNRILSNDASHIFGQIEANGQIILTNPNGVFFGKDATINVGSLVASGLSIDPDEFMNGQFTLDAIDNTEGFVLNHGIINAATGGSVTLVGKKVENQGLITAKLGSVSLAAGKQAVLTFDSQGLLGVRVTEEVLQQDIGVDAAVQNSGEINADGGKVLLTASTSQDVFSKAVNSGGLSGETSVVMHDDGSFTLGGGADVVNTGTISVANSTSDEPAGAVVVLGENIHNSGTISADSSSGTAGHIELHAADTTLIIDEGVVTASASEQGQGGDVKVLGDKVGLSETATVKADGAEGGGQVLVGGDQQGENDQIRNAEFVYLGKDTTVSASAETSGDGGTVIVYADDSARIYGELSATGGSQSGNGGFIETSGKKGFDLDVVPDVRADNGVAGTWLIDPYDITIDVVPTSDVDIVGLPTPEFTSIQEGAILDVADLMLGLESGGTVSIYTGGDESTGIDGGDINFNADVTYEGAAVNFELHAFRDINFNADLDASNADGRVNLYLYANRGGLGGDITLGDVTIDTNGGLFLAEGTNIDASLAQIDVLAETPAVNNRSGEFSFEAEQDISVGSLGENTRDPVAFHSSIWLNSASGTINVLGDLYSNGRLITIDGPTLNFADGIVVSSKPFDDAPGSNGTINIKSDADLILPTIETVVVGGAGSSSLDVESISGTVDVANPLRVDGTLEINAGGSILVSDFSTVDVVKGDGNILLKANDSIVLGYSTLDNIQSSGDFVLPDLDIDAAAMERSLVADAGGQVLISNSIALADGHIIISAGGNPSAQSYDSSLSAGSVLTNHLSTRGQINIHAASDITFGNIGYSTNGGAEFDRLSSRVEIISGGNISTGQDAGVWRSSGYFKLEASDNSLGINRGIFETANGIAIDDDENGFNLTQNLTIDSASERSITVEAGSGFDSSVSSSFIGSDGGEVSISTNTGAISFGSDTSIDTSGGNTANPASGTIRLISGANLTLPSLSTNPNGFNSGLQINSLAGSVYAHRNYFASGSVNIQAGEDIVFSEAATVDLDLNDDQSFLLDAGNAIGFAAHSTGFDELIFVNSGAAGFEMLAGYGVHLASSLSLGQGNLIVHGGIDGTKTSNGNVSTLFSRGIRSTGAITTNGNVFLRGSDLVSVTGIGDSGNLGLAEFDLQPSSLYIGAGGAIQSGPRGLDVNGNVTLIVGEEVLPERVGVQVSEDFTLGLIPELVRQGAIIGEEGEIEFTYVDDVGDYFVRSNGGNIQFLADEVYFPAHVFLDPSSSSGHGDIRVTSNIGNAWVPQIVYSQESLTSSAATVSIESAAEIIWLPNLDYNNADVSISLSAIPGTGTGDFYLGQIDENEDPYFPNLNALFRPWTLEQIQGSVFDSDLSSDNSISITLDTHGNINHKLNIDAADGSYIINSAQDVTISNQSLFNMALQ